jgi:alkanesulfonate monooxygenase SsuD/methylene tetrahydromethanopterin reductase-like flavin-dependent oxidoreductase (luciferase family)
LNFGVITLPNVGWEELVRRWRYLDEVGVETVWVADHLASYRRPEQTWFEGWTCLATMAAVTERARIGPLVSPITLRNPAVLAKAAATVDHASSGRLELAVGAGGSEPDQTLAVGRPWSAAERSRRLRDFVERLVELLGSQQLQPPPVQPRLPLTIAGQADGTVRLAAVHADRWNTYVGEGLEPDEAVQITRERNELLTRACEEIGRDPAEVRRSVLIGYPFVGETPWRSEAALRDVVERWAAIGVEELVFYYPAELAMPEGSVEPGLFERAFREILPGI